jgi:uncharacterized protein YjiS (DUF1127 family)
LGKAKEEPVMASSTDFALRQAHATVIAFPKKRRERTAGHRHPLVRLISVWIERARQRRALADLDDRLLRDIGTTRREAMDECDKPFWR